MDLYFDHKIQLTDDIFTFNFRRDPAFRFVAGQFCEVTIHTKDHEDTKRWFSLSSSPSEEFVSITTKLPSTSSTFKSSFQALSAGDLVHFSAPLGDFVLPKMASIPLVFIAGGLGCTPFRSILKELESSSEKRDIQLYVSYRSQEKGIFEDVFEKLGEKYHPAYSERLDIAEIINASSAENAYFYIAGPEDMVEETKAQLLNAEIPERHVFIDNFIGYVEPLS